MKSFDLLAAYYGQKCPRQVRHEQDLLQLYRREAFESLAPPCAMLNKY